MMKSRFSIVAAAIASIALLSPAIAGNTNFLTERNGAITFPFSPPNRANSTPALIDNTTIGATTPAPGNFTTLSSTIAPSGAGVTALFASPPPIGATAANSGKFTTGNFSGQITSSAGLPTIASGACGTTTNGAVVAGSTNQAGSITIGAAATTTCTISWSATLAAAPKACVFMAMNAAAIAATTLPFVSAPSTASVVFNGAVLANTNWSYICL
jgi:hypothetical protein